MQDSRRIVPHSNNGRPFGVGAIRLSQPGHYFTVKFNDLLSSVDRVSIGVICENCIPHDWGKATKPVNKVAVDQGMITAWSHRGQQMGVRVCGNRTPLSGLTPWKAGDEVTVTLGTKNEGLAVGFARNGKHFTEIVVPDGFTLPCLPVCRISTFCELDMIGGVGQNLEELL